MKLNTARLIHEYEVYKTRPVMFSNTLALGGWIDIHNKGRVYRTSSPLGLLPAKWRSKCYRATITHASSPLPAIPTRLNQRRLSEARNGMIGGFEYVTDS